MHENSEALYPPGNTSRLIGVVKGEAELENSEALYNRRKNFRTRSRPEILPD